MLKRRLFEAGCQCACHTLSSTPTTSPLTSHSFIPHRTSAKFAQLSLQQFPASIPSCPVQTAEQSTKSKGSKCPFSKDGFLRSRETISSSDIKPFSEMPGPKGLPLVGNYLAYTKLGSHSLEKIVDSRLAYTRQYGPIYREQLGSMDMVHLFDPSDVATMFRQEGDFPSRGNITTLERTYLERNKHVIGFAFLDGPEWARQRQIIQKLMMHPSAATRYLHMQLPVVSEFVNYLDQQKQPDCLVPNFYDQLFKYTIEAIGVVCFDERLGTFSVDQTQEEAIRSQELVEAIRETFYCFRQCMFGVPFYKYWRTPLYRRFEKAADTMRQIMAGPRQRIADKVQAAADRRRRYRRLGKSQETISESYAALEEEMGALCPFVLELLAEERSMFEVLISDQRLTESLAHNLIMALFRTGIDSTANALAFLLYNLARNPDKQQRLYDEITACVGSGSVTQDTITADIIARMPYLKAAIKESFRLNFPVFGGSGRVAPTDMVLSGYRVPAGKFLFANMAAMGLMEEYFPRPQEYHPERWLRDDRAEYQTQCTKDAGFLSQPFSAGKRACPGKRFAEQAICLPIIMLLNKFRLEHVGEPVGMLSMPFTIPDRALNIRFVPR